MGSDLPSPICGSVQAAARHVLDAGGPGGEEGRRVRHHGQTPEPEDIPTASHRAQLQGPL